MAWRCGGSRRFRRFASGEEWAQSRGHGRGTRRRVLEAGEEDHDCSWSLMVGLEKNQALAGRVFPCGLPHFSMEKASGRQAGRKCDGLHVGSWLVTKDLAATGQGTVDTDGLELHKLEVYPGGSTLGTVGGGDNGSVGVHGTLLELLGRVAILSRRVGSRRCCLLSGAGARRWMRPTHQPRGSHCLLECSL